MLDTGGGSGEAARFHLISMFMAGSIQILLFQLFLGTFDHLISLTLTDTVDEIDSPDDFVVARIKSARSC